MSPLRNVRKINFDEWGDRIMRRIGLVVAAAAIFASGSTARAGAGVADEPERVELKDGHAVIGEVVAEKPAALYVDLGFDVIRIPKDHIIRRGKADSLGPVVSTAPATVAAVEGDPRGFFTVDRLKSRPVKELVDDYGEAVVSVETPSGLGSGFIVNPEGYVVTNNHVIQGETRIAVVLYQKTGGGLQRRKIEDVEIVALNPFVDLALLKIPPQKDLKLRHVVLGSLDEINAGDGAFAVGNPLGLERSVSQGIISTMNRVIGGLVYIQTDTAINPGNSGGPLFDLKGEVIGVTSQKMAFAENLGFAIPITYVKDFLRNCAAFAFNKDNPNTGHRYLDPPRRLRRGRRRRSPSPRENRKPAPRTRCEFVGESIEVAAEKCSIVGGRRQWRIGASPGPASRPSRAGLVRSKGCPFVEGSLAVRS